MTLRIADLMWELRTLAPPDWCVAAERNTLSIAALSPADVSLAANSQTYSYTVDAEDAAYSVLVTSPASMGRFAVDAVFRAARRLAERSYELSAVGSMKDSYAAQITKTFEELAWLRGLADSFGHCDLRNDIFSLADRLMPDLTALIKADHAVFLDQAYRPTAVEPIAERTDSERQPFPYRYRAMIDTLCPDSGPAVVVVNAGTSQTLRGYFPELFSAIVMRLSTGNESIGWMIAARFFPIGITRSDLGSLTVDQQSHEFGTFEAGLLQSAATILTTHGLNLRLMQDKEQLVIAAVRSLVNAIEARDPYTFGHSERVASYALQIAEAIGLDDLARTRIHMTGLLHDVGKIGVPDRVLLKPGKLDDEEFDIIKQHPLIGYNILQPVPQLHYTLEGVRHHHERFDGRGYPDGMVGDAIPLFGRILAVADAYDAMTSSRPYRHAMSVDKAVGILREGAGSYWDPMLIEIFLDILRRNGTIATFETSPLAAMTTVAQPYLPHPVAV